MNLKNILFVAAALIVMGACGHKKLVFDNNSVSGGGVVTTVQWIKHKGKKIDVQYTFENKSGKPVIIRENAFNLTYGGKATTPNKKHRVYEIQPGAADTVIMTYMLGEPTPRGQKAVIMVDPINEGSLEKVGKKLPPAKFEVMVQ